MRTLLWTHSFIVGFPSATHSSQATPSKQIWFPRICHRGSQPAASPLDASAHGAHSMRRAKAAQIYKKTSNLRAAQLLLGHTKLESAVRYLEIEVNDAVSISEQADL